MSNFNPTAEKATMWGYSYEQIKHRWEVWQNWDIVYRISKMFSGDEDDKPKKTTYNNSEEEFERVCRLLPRGGKETMN